MLRETCAIRLWFVKEQKSIKRFKKHFPEAIFTATSTEPAAPPLTFVLAKHHYCNFKFSQQIRHTSLSLSFSFSPSPTVSLSLSLSLSLSSPFTRYFLLRGAKEYPKKSDYAVRIQWISSRDGQSDFRHQHLLTKHPKISSLWKGKRKFRR